VGMGCGVGYVGTEVPTYPVGNGKGKCRFLRFAAE
jgi:hypothetical protein